MKYRALSWRRYSLLAWLCLLMACHAGDREASLSGETDSLLHSAPVIAYTDSIRQFPDSPAYYFERGGILYSLQHYAEARKDVEKALSLNPREKGYYFALGQIDEADGQWQAALAHYRQAIQHTPDDRQIRLQIAYVLFAHQQFDSMFHEIDTLIAQFPHSSEAYGLQARAYEATGDTAKALAAMHKAVQEDPQNYNATMGMGDLLSKAKDPEAISWYDKALQIDSTQAEPWYAKAQFYESVSAVPHALECYRQCINTDRDYLKAYIGLSRLYGSGHDWEKGRSVADLAIRVDPTYAEAFYQRGICNEHLGNRQAAINDYQQCMALDKNNKSAKLALQRLQEASAR